MQRQPRQHEQPEQPEQPDSASPAGRQTDRVDEPPLTGWAAFYDFVMQSYCWVIIFLMLYVLSAGPFYEPWRRAVDMGRRPLLQAVYMPLAGLCSEYEMVNTVVEWYVGLWQS